MSVKSILIPAKPTPKIPVNADAWVKDREAREIAEPTSAEVNNKRLTIDISEALHRAIKSACAMRGTKIADEVRELLLQKYGNP